MLYQSPVVLPNKFKNPMIFIAGGISKCPQWQNDLINYIDINAFDVVNPRRIGDLAKNGPEAKEQITWEYNALELCDHVVFWFPSQSVCPITLMELGKMLEKSIRKPIKITIGYEQGYERKFDLEAQTELVKFTLKARKGINYINSSIHIFDSWKKFVVYIEDQYGANL